MFFVYKKTNIFDTIEHNEPKHDLKPEEGYLTTYL